MQRDQGSTGKDLEETDSKLIEQIELLTQTIEKLEELVKQAKQEASVSFFKKLGNFFCFDIPNPIYIGILY